MAKTKKKSNGAKRPTHPANLSQDLSHDENIPLGQNKRGGRGTK